MNIFFITHLLNTLYYLFILYTIYILYTIVRDGDWGLGIGDWGLGIGPKPQSTIPNPQSPIPIVGVYLVIYTLLKIAHIIDLYYTF